MQVGVQGDGDGGMAETLTDDLGMHPGLQGEGGMRVAPVIEPRSWLG